VGAASEADDAGDGSDGEADEFGALPVVTYEVFLARDPFERSVPEPVVATDGTDGDATDDTTDDGDADGGDADDGDAADDGTGGEPSGCSNGDEPVCDGRVVSLIELDEVDGERVAVIQVDTTIYEVRVGEIFAGSFLVQSISSDQVTVVYGDDVIVLREGDRVLK
jgi:hypothetical protein